MDDGERGQAIEIEQLVRTRKKDGAHFRRQTVDGSLAASRKAGIERRLPPKHSRDDFQQEPSVARIFDIRAVLLDFTAECCSAALECHQDTRRVKPGRHWRAGGIHRSKRSPGSTGRPFR